MQISVLICTWNRCKLLNSTLENLRSVRVPPDLQWEILVVDNNSTDDTQNVIHSYSELLPISTHTEKKQGLSNARNCAVQNASGEWTFWLDDDVLVDEDWLEMYLNAIHEFPDASFFGGTIQPWFEINPPRWMLRHYCRLKGCHAVRDALSRGTKVTTDHLPFGANMAIRRDVQLMFPYNPELGRIGNGMMGGEETAFFSRLLDNSHTGIWIPEASVRHFIPKSRLTIDYLKKFFRGYGQYLQKTSNSEETVKFYGIPRWLVKRYLYSLIQEFITRPFKTKFWLESFINNQITQGQVEYIFSQTQHKS